MLNYSTATKKIFRWSYTKRVQPDIAKHYNETTTKHNEKINYASIGQSSIDSCAENCKLEIIFNIATQSYDDMQI